MPAARGEASGGFRPYGTRGVNVTTLYVTEHHSIIRKAGDTIEVHVPADKKSGREERRVSLPLVKIEQVVILSDSTVTAQALTALMEQGVVITFHNAFGALRGRLVPAEGRNSLLRLAQFRAHEDPLRCFALARQFVRGKIHNMRTFLLRANRKLEDEEIGQAVEALRNILEEVEGLRAEEALPAQPSKPQADSAWGSLQGLEGAAAARYFGVFGRLLRGDPALVFEGRSRRPPRDPVNALLSFGYALLLHQCIAAVQMVGLDAYIGYLHSSQYSKPALALDLMEEFRVLLVDSVVVSLINMRVIGAEDFEEEWGAWRLKEKPRRTFLQKYEERLNETIAHPVFKYQASYRRCLELQARLLAKALYGEIAAYPPFRVR